MSPKWVQKCYFFMVSWRRSLKWKHTFGLRRRERIEVQATLETSKKQPTHDMQTNAHTHLRFWWKSAGKAFKREYEFRSKTALFFRISTLGPRGCQKKPQSCPRTAKVPQMVAQGCTNVSKGCGNGAQKLLKAWQYHKKGAAVTQTSVISTSITQKHTKQEVRTCALRNCTCNAQWRAWGARAQTNKQRNKQTKKQTNKQTNTQTDKQASKQTSHKKHKTKG